MLAAFSLACWPTHGDRCRRRSMRPHGCFRCRRTCSGTRNGCEYLLTTQHPAGHWGGPGAYALVPTLSATEALLSHVDSPARAAGPADRGLRWLLGWLSTA